MAKIYPIFPRAVVVGGGGGAPTGEWNEDVAVGDAPVVGTVLADDTQVADAFALAGPRLADDVTVDDSLRTEITANFAEDTQIGDEPLIGVTLAEDWTADDALALAAMTLADDVTADDSLSLSYATLADDVSVNDKATIRALLVDSARTGTPNSDMLTDGWTDQASTTTNHGNENLLVKGKSTAGSDERRGFLCIALKDFFGAGYTAANNGLTLFFWASTSSVLLADTLTWSAGSASGGRPFTESALTWAVQPAVSTGLGTGTVSVNTGAAQLFSITLTVANLNASTAYNTYVYFSFTMASTVAPNTVTITSRDFATVDTSGLALGRPFFTINSITRGT